MAFLSLDLILDSISGYNTVIENYSFKANSSGKKPWSHRYTKDNADIEIRASEWTYYLNNKEIATGSDFQSLQDYLSDIEIYVAFDMN
ncbi:MAG: hypothetical protein ACXW2E_00755 [Nitrososphaeraceae archaeon]